MVVVTCVVADVVDLVVVVLTVDVVAVVVVVSTVVEVLVLAVHAVAPINTATIKAVKKYFDKLFISIILPFFYIYNNLIVDILSPSIVIDYMGQRIAKS